MGQLLEEGKVATDGCNQLPVTGFMESCLLIKQML